MTTFAHKIKKGVKNPRLIIKFVLDKSDSIFRKKYRWVKNGSKVQKRQYSSYEEYLEHQKSKLKKVKGHIDEYDNKYRDELKKRLVQGKIVKPGMNVLCLAARIGTEVKSFLDIGCFAIGLDLNPGKENKYVVYGDFHNVQFPAHSVDVIFSNSLDHAYDLERLIKEIKRVLKPKGFLVLEIVNGTQEGIASPGYWEASFWEKVDDLLELFSSHGFKVIQKSNFEYPWKGQHVSLALVNSNKIN